jgi:chaperone BCS1
MFGLLTASTFLWRHAFDLFEKYCMSAISVECHDDIYEYLMAWLSAQKVTQNSRSLMAKTGRESAWDLTNSEIVDEDMDEDMDENVLLNFSNWDAKVPPTYEPFFGSHRFWHKGAYYIFSRENKQMMYAGWGRTTRTSV